MVHRRHDKFIELFLSRYEEMMRDEHITSQEVAALDKCFDSRSQQVPALDLVKTPKTTTRALPSHRDTDRDLPPEVKTFEVLLVNPLPADYSGQYIPMPLPIFLIL